MTHYWLFQSNPKIFNLKEALRFDMLDTFAVVSHKKRIAIGDKVILWQTGKEAGVYGLATVTSEVKEGILTEKEAQYYTELPDEDLLRVAIQVDYNFWSRPLTKDLLPDSKDFEAFHAGLPGTNFTATKAQYDAIIRTVRKEDIVAEPEVAYTPARLLQHPLNLILYGPPGTGKTYQTVNHALSIIENRPLSELALESRKNLRQRYEYYVQSGQIHFVTFHPSFSYEDFVEGIKPVLKEDKILYAIKNGIFKLVCMEARRLLMQTLLGHLPQEQKHVEFNQLYTAFLEYLKSDNFSHFVTPAEKRVFLHKVLPMGNLSLRRENSFSVQTIHKNQLKKIHQTYPSIQQIKNVDVEIRSLIGQGSPRAYWAVFHAFKTFEEWYMQQPKVEAEENAIEQTTVQELDIPALPKRVLAQCKKIVLIIDEINRGNIPSIFGELITLLEADKREGEAEAVATILPYSKMLFSVPPNLYLIGTMNTTDRSVEALDVALRRRFTFREMLPNTALIPKVAKQPITAGVDLEKLLAAINQRIEVLLDKDYCIGHAYFLNISTLSDLKQVFALKIIPLLQEYFFNDLGKIGLILGRDFIVEKRYSSAAIFADFEHEYANELAEKRVYALRDIGELEAADFIRIYNSNYK